MKILIINCGSSSLKYKLIDMGSELDLVSGVVEEIGGNSAVTYVSENTGKIKIDQKIADHQEAVDLILKLLVDPEKGVIGSLDEISAVGHRVVHGGERFKSSVLIDQDVIDGIEECSELAPLHNSANLIGIRSCQKVMPEKRMVVVFDTAFHQTMPKEAYLYAIPYEYYEKYKIRKYGFHGTSHKYVAQRAADILGKNIDELNIITCHLGNGSSLTAVRKGKSFNTSMGFTPLAGVAMGTRSGTIDPAIISFLMKKEDLTIEEVDDILNKRSGLLGISGISSDCREIEDAAWNKDDERAQLALDKFSFRVKEYLGAYAITMDGVDAIVFTAGLGENSPETREFVCRDLDHFGIKLDPEKNKVRGKESVISSDDSKIKIMVIPTNEELMIAKETKDVLDDQSS